MAGRNGPVNASGNFVGLSCIGAEFEDDGVGMFASLTTIADTPPPLSTPVFTAFWFVIVFVVAGLAAYLGRRFHDRAYLYYGGYVGALGLMSLIDHGWGDWMHEQMGDSFVFLNNLLHLPYAVCYLLFVMQYFNVRENSPIWYRFHRGLLWAYGAVFGWLLFDAITKGSGSEWGILSCNLVNLLSSLVLAGVATHDNRAGGREFLYASLPLTVSGLVLVAQFLSNSSHESGPGLLAFRAGFIMHIMIFLVALGVRYRELRNRLE